MDEDGTFGQGRVTGERTCLRNGQVRVKGSLNSCYSLQEKHTHVRNIDWVSGMMELI